MSSGLDLMSTPVPKKDDTSLPSTPDQRSYRRQAFDTISTIFIRRWTESISTQGYHRIIKTSPGQFESFLQVRHLDV